MPVLYERHFLGVADWSDNKALSYPPESSALFLLTRRRLLRISATYPPSRGGRGCSRGSTSWAESCRKRWTRGETLQHVMTPDTVQAVHARPGRPPLPSSPQREGSSHVVTVICVRDALNKMKDVYEKNPQMGDPSSLQPKISETICNMERLRSEIHKNEVKRIAEGRTRTWRQHVLPRRAGWVWTLSSLYRQTWLSEVEGKQSSRGDRRHSADNHHHTPQGRERWTIYSKTGCSDCIRISQ